MYTGMLHTLGYTGMLHTLGYTRLLYTWWYTRLLYTWWYSPPVITSQDCYSRLLLPLRTVIPACYTPGWLSRLLYTRVVILPVYTSGCGIPRFIPRVGYPWFIPLRVGYAFLFMLPGGVIPPFYAPRRVYRLFVADRLSVPGRLICLFLHKVDNPAPTKLFPRV